MACVVRDAGIVLSALLALPLLAPAGARASDPPALTASSVTSTGASLDLSNHTGTYYLEGTGRNSYSYACTQQTAGTAVSVSGLTGNSTYSFSAYSASGCTGDALDTTTFTTPGSLSVLTHNISKNALFVELGGWSSGSDQWSYDLTSPTDNGSERVSNVLACRDLEGDRLGAFRGVKVPNLLAGTDYTLRAYWGGGCSALNLLGSADLTTQSSTWSAPSLAVSSITRYSAVVTISNWKDSSDNQKNWWYEVWRGGAPISCTQAPISTISVTLGSLQYDTTYYVVASSEAGCSKATGAIEFWSMASFATLSSLTITTSNTTATGFTVTLTGHTDDDTFPNKWALDAVRKKDDGYWESSDCYVKNKSDTTVAVSGLTAGQTYTIQVFRASWCNFNYDRATFSTTTTSLTSSLGQGVATLSLNEHAGAWSYSGQVASRSAASASAAGPPGGGPARLWAASVNQCRAMPSGTYTANLSGLAADTSYSFTAYNDQACVGDELGTTTLVTPENWDDGAGPGLDDGDDGGNGGGSPGGPGGPGGNDSGDDDDDDDNDGDSSGGGTGGGGGDPEPPPMPERRWLGDLALQVPDDGAFVLSWRGEWQEAGGPLAIEARSREHGWQDLLTGVDAAAGEARIEGLDEEAAYTLRLRREAAAGFAHSAEISGVPDGWRGRCRGGLRYMCLRDRRFELRAHWSNPDVAGDMGNGGAVKTGISDESGLFWFFDPANVELVVKVLDGRDLNGAHWVFFGALSDVEYWLTVRDAETGAARTYHNPPKEVCGQSDVQAFEEQPPIAAGSSSTAGSLTAGPPDFGGIDLVNLNLAPLPLGAPAPSPAPSATPRSGEPEPRASAASSQSAGACVPSADRLCLLDGRFALEVRFIDPNVTDPEASPEKPGYVLPSLTTGQTGFFWFFDEENIELAAKVLDGRALNGRHWLLYGGLSDVEYTLTATDTVTSLTKDYTNKRGSVCGGVDTNAF